MGAAASTSTNQEVAIEEGIKETKFEDLSTVKENIEEDEASDAEEPEDEGRDSPNSPMNNLDWLSTLSLTELQELADAVQEQKLKKEQEERVKTKSFHELRAEYLSEVDRIQKLKEQIKGVTDEEQRSQLMLVLKNEREILLQKKQAGYYKLAKYSLASPEDARYYTYKDPVVRKNEKPEDVLGLYGIKSEDANTQQDEAPVIDPFTEKMIERSIRTPPKLQEVPMVETPDTIKAQEIAAAMQRMQQAYSNMTPAEIQHLTEEPEEEAGCIIN